MSDIHDLVRVKHRETGHHYTVSRAHAAANTSTLQVLDGAPALDANGRPLPPKTHLDPEPAKAPAVEIPKTSTERKAEK